MPTPADEWFNGAKTRFRRVRRLAWQPIRSVQALRRILSVSCGPFQYLWRNQYVDDTNCNHCRSDGLVFDDEKRYCHGYHATRQGHSPPKEWIPKEQLSLRHISYVVRSERQLYSRVFRSATERRVYIGVTEHPSRERIVRTHPNP
jgi:hypothetical protein